jgi:hypothetical protein
MEREQSSVDQQCAAAPVQFHDVTQALALQRDGGTEESDDAEY